MIFCDGFCKLLENISKNDINILIEVIELVLNQYEDNKDLLRMSFLVVDLKF
jgi:hypothetical protein